MVSGSSDIVIVSFVLAGPNLDPTEVTSEIGLRPTRAYRKGEAMPRPGHYYATGLWSLKSSRAPSASLEEQIASLLNELEPRAAEVRRTVRTGIDAGFYCTCAVGNPPIRVCLTASTLSRLGELNLDLVMDISHDPDVVAPA